jgi:hypothetical protein
LDVGVDVMMIGSDVVCVRSKQHWLVGWLVA